MGAGFLSAGEGRALGAVIGSSKSLSIVPVQRYVRESDCVILLTRIQTQNYPYRASSKV